MKAWINADNGSHDMKLAVSEILVSREWDVHIGETGSNVHYKDYFNVTEDHDIYITMYNGFCAGTVREAYSPEIQEELRRKKVRLVIVWDSREWLEVMKPYRYGNFRGYHARRAWDDNFSKEDPYIEDVWGFLREHDAVYCVGPDAELIVEQLAAGGYFSWEAGAANRAFSRDYDYYWLKYTMERGVREQAQTLLTGHSLARFGINDAQIPGLVNLAFLSQDYYYSSLIIHSALERIPSLRTVILGVSYISPFMDLSRSKNQGEIARITQVYGKYFGDYHHMDRGETHAQAAADGEPEDRPFDERLMSDLYETMKSDYFFGERNRQSLSDFDWSGSMTEEARFEAARARTDFHNRLLNHRETYEENGEILTRIAEYCGEKKVEFRIVVFPSNRYYRHFLDPGLKEAYDDQLRRCLAKEPARHMDLFDDDRFDNILDYIDTDHLNDRGAVKMTEILKRWLEVE